MLRKRARRSPAAMHNARKRLRFFKQASLLAVALTGLLLLVLAPGEAQVAEEENDPRAVATDHSAADETEPQDIPPERLPEAAGEELVSAVRNLWGGLLLNLPKYLVVGLLLLMAWVLSRLLRRLIRRLLKDWERAAAIIVLSMAAYWLVVFGIGVSILAGDFRALLGSLGLVGLALSWALQTPIESFTGWLLNSFKGYYRIGDRIAVGEIFGDVYRIDVLTTTLWEIGGPDRPPPQVHAEQPSGRLITFPNNEILTGTVINLTRDFPWVWNELEIPLAPESDIDYALEVLEKIASDVVGDYMKDPAQRYASLLESARLNAVAVSDRPQLYVSLAESWVTVTIRYLVGARERRTWQSELTQRILTELRKPEHTARIPAAYPRRQLQWIDACGSPQGRNGTVSKTSAA